MKQIKITHKEYAALHKTRKIWEEKQECLEGDGLMYFVECPLCLVYDTDCKKCIYYRTFGYWCQGDRGHFHKWTKSLLNKRTYQSKRRSCQSIIRLIDKWIAMYEEGRK